MYKHILTKYITIAIFFCYISKIKTKQRLQRKKLFKILISTYLMKIDLDNISI